MSASSSCPEPDQLRKLLDGDLAPNQQIELTSHLDTCPNCQETLEVLASGDKRWAGAPADLPREQPAPEPALQQLINELKQKASEAVTQVELSASSKSGLEFLAPPQKPGHLGSIDQYEVTELIGRGGMGVVLKAFDPSLHRFVAIKVLSPHLATSETARKRFTREARAAAAVNHEHVVAIHQVDEFNGLPYLVMEYVRGNSLQQRLERSGVLKLKEILRIGMQIASGLAAAHAQGLVHRDIKPANILLENGVERVKITDFGLARAANDASLTQSGVVAGTPQYMSPEQARGEAVDHRADLFSLGTVLYALCTGRVPFQADTSVAVLYNVCQETPRPVQDLNAEMPDWLVQIIMKLHAKDKAERFQSAAEIAELLGRHLAHLQQPQLVAIPAGEPSKSSVRAAREGPKHRRWAFAAAAIVLVIGGLGMTDALGVTNVTDFVATTLRIRTPHGTLVLEISDPSIDVAIDGEDVSITGAGVHEIRLKPGAHVLHGTRQGQPVDLGTITISRGDKKVLKITQEDSKSARQAFVDGETRKLSVDETRKIRAFTTADKTITQDGISAEDDGLRIDSAAKRLVRLYELPNPNAEDCVVTYRARMKSNLTEGQAYLEMWCRLPGLGEAFSKGLSNPMQGTMDWATYETPFFLKKGERPDMIKLNLVVEGKGTIWVKDIEVLKSPMNPALLERPQRKSTTQTAPTGGKTGKIKSFSPPDRPIAQDGVSVDQGGWKIESKESPHTVRLFEVEPGPGVDECMVFFRAKMKVQNQGLIDALLQGSQAYLEMWCRVPPFGEAFSKGMGLRGKDTVTDDEADKLFRKQDKNGDGFLDADEMPENLRAEINLWDKDKNGLIDLKEFRAWAKAWKSYEIPFRLEKGQQPDLIKLNVVMEKPGTIWIKDIELVKAPLP